MPVSAFVLVAWIATIPDAGAACDGSFDNRDLNKELYAIENALEREDVDAAKVELTRVGERLVCLSEIVDTRHLARFSIAMATAAFYRQDDLNVVRWGLNARTVSRDEPVPWPEHIGTDHPLYQRVEALELPPIGQADGGFTVTRGGGVFLNGRFAPRPEAYAEVPVLVQVFDERAALFVAYWQEGVAFRPGVVDPTFGSLRRPRWYTDDGRVRAPRQTRIPVVPFVIAGALAATSAITYGVAGSTAAGMPQLDTADELKSARSTTNALVLVSGVTGAGALGFGLGGVFAIAF